jgi:hypothetical protein
MTKTPVAAISILCAELVLVAACAARAKNGPAEESVSRDLITASELAHVDAVNAFTAIQQLRPLWLRSRGAMSFTEPGGTLPTVYVDNLRYGDISALSAIPIAEIAEIRYISAADATTRWGTGVVGGVIEVIRKTRSKKV